MKISEWRNRLLGFALVAVLVTAAGFSRVHLDETADQRNQFQEMLYVPGGTALKLAADGFSTPLADYWWLQGLLYFSDNFRAAHRDVKEARYRYLFQLFNVVTDLSPRFWRAYVVGSQFLSSGNEPERLQQASKLLEKGVRVQNEDVAAGRPWTPDSRWRLHMQLAYLYDVQIQSTARAAGDLATAHAARKRMEAEYALAASMPNCDPLVIAAYENVRASSVEEANLSQRLALSAALLERQIVDLVRDGRTELTRRYRTELAFTLAKHAAIQDVEQLEKDLTAAAAKTGRPVNNPWALFNPRTVRAADALDGSLLFDRRDADADIGDDFIALPDGRIRSIRLVLLEEEALRGVIEDRCIDFASAHDRGPDDLSELVTDGLLSKVPEHPLASLGSRYVYDPETWSVIVAFPLRYRPMPAPLARRPLPELPRDQIPE